MPSLALAMGAVLSTRGCTGRRCRAPTLDLPPVHRREQGSTEALALAQTSAKRRMKADIAWRVTAAPGRNVPSA